MKKNQETAHAILLEILNGTRPLTEDGIRALVQEDPEIAVLLILEQARRLRDIIGSKQRKAANTPSRMIPPHEKPNTQKDKKKKRRGLNPVPIIIEALKTLITTGELPPFPPAVSSVG